MKRQKICQRKNHNTIVFTCGVFDLFHKGHKELLELMNKISDNVIVYLHDDTSTYENKDKFPVQSYEHREKNLKRTGLVTVIKAVCMADPTEYFETLSVNAKINNMKLVYVRGDDWKDAPGLNYLKRQGVQIIYKKYTKGISSTKLRSEL